MTELLRDLPSVDQLLQTQQAESMIAVFGRPETLRVVREVLADLRKQIGIGGHPQPGDKPGLIDQAAILEKAASRLAQWFKPSLQPVINATGVVLHTNLGRAPLSRAATQAVAAAAAGYSNLEFDLDRGSRGSRLIHAEALLCRLTGAEAALVVNNNAAALLLALSALARRRRVIIARSQLVEVGGGFRIPDVMIQSGARLVEVGTTNRVHVHDYAEALAEPAALVLRAHHSNFRIIGFTTEPSLDEMVKTAHAAGVSVLDDLGSGALLDTARYGLPHEPTVQESLAAGADLVCFSGDKLLGGPQAGILLGRADLLAKIKRHPLARAMRADKLCLAALSATLLHYLKDEADQTIPIWRMIAQSPEHLNERVRQWIDYLGTGEAVAGYSTVGGGSLPEEMLPTRLLALTVRRPNLFLARLRAAQPPVIGRVTEDRVVLDPRTVLPDEEDTLLAVVKQVLTQPGGKMERKR